MWKMKIKNKGPHKNVKRRTENSQTQTTSLLFSVAYESFQANYCRVFVSDPHTQAAMWKTKTSTLPEMTRRPQENTRDVAFDYSPFVILYFCVSLRFPHTGLGVWKTKTLP